MNEELQKALAELLSKANNGIDAAGGFIEAELPEVISQLLMWKTAYNLIYIVIVHIGPSSILNYISQNDQGSKFVTEDLQLLKRKLRRFR